MSQAIYLSPKTTGNAVVVFIKTNTHNPKGWVEKPNGEVIKLHNRICEVSNHATNSTNA